MADATFTFRVDDELKTAFNDAAKTQDMTSAQLLRGFMREYVKRQQTDADYDAWFRDSVRAGQASAARGELLAGDDVEAAFRERREATRRRLKASAQ